MPTAPRKSFRRLVSERCGAVLLGGLVALMAPATHAETRVEGQVDSIRLEAHDATVREVLAALSASYHLRFRSSTPLDRSATGSFNGPLLRVIATVLASYNYVVKNEEDGTIEVIVLGSQGPTPQPAPSAQTPTWDAFVSTPQPAQRDAPAPAPSQPAPALGSTTLTDWEMRGNIGRPAR
jgi:hypothetical protein